MKISSVEPESINNYITLVVQLQMMADGMWQVSVIGTDTIVALPLAPLILVVRLWRPPGTTLLRGTIRLGDSDHWAPIQSNHRLEELVRAWLSSGGRAAGS